MKTSLNMKSYGRRKAVDRFMRGMTVGATLLALIPLFLILGYVLVKGASALSWSFLSTDYKVPELSLDGGPSDVGGIRHAIIGTLIIAGSATLMALPIGLLAGVYLSEYSGGRFSTLVRFATDVLSGAPSIIAGVVVYIVLVQTTKQKYAFYGAAALAILMIPIIVRTTEEILKLVPQTVREASIALGVPKWKTTLTVVIPAALSGILTGVMLAFARAAGETAPLLVTVFVSNSVRYNVFGDMGSLPMYIFRTLDELTDEQQYSVLWGASFVLTALVLVVNILVRVATRKKR
ncbi:MAG TPA: phosphate ABC transporter permease PstA [Herpetosiphonaceae bacterium]